MSDDSISFIVGAAMVATAWFVWEIIPSREVYQATRVYHNCKEHFPNRVETMCVREWAEVQKLKRREQ